MKSILILCTGNSCRSQMAEGFLKSFDNNLIVRSAGTNPSNQVHPKAVQVMTESGIDLSNGKPENVDKYLNDAWDYVITVCDNAKETCPFFPGAKEYFHQGFADPVDTPGSEEEKITAFRRIRDEIRQWIALKFSEEV